MACRAMSHGDEILREKKKTFLKLALRLQLVLLLLCKRLFQVILVNVFFKWTWKNWVTLASCLPAVHPSDSHPSRAPLCLFLSKKQAKDRGTDPQAWSDLRSSACGLAVIPRGDRVLCRAQGWGGAGRGGAGLG